MDLTIIIVNWNTRALLENCLHSIGQTKGNLKVQIIVVDNASIDGSKDMVAALFPEVYLISSGGNLGFAKANNLAIPYAEAPLILFLNPDTILKERSLAAMVDFLKAHPSVGALGCKIRDLNDRVQELPLQMRISPLKKLFDLLLVSEKTMGTMRRIIPYQDPNRSGYVSLLYGACLMVRKITLDQVGSFDERFFMYCEDVDLCHRIGAQGWKLYYLDAAEIIHLIGGATKETKAHFGILMMCDSIAKLMEKYHGNAGKMLYTVAVLISSPVRLCMIFLFKIAGYFSARAGKMVNESSIDKHVTMVKWSLGLEKLAEMQK
jgi:hypothetical protein